MQLNGTNVAERTNGNITKYKGIWMNCKYSIVTKHLKSIYIFFKTSVRCSSDFVIDIINIDGYISHYRMKVLSSLHTQAVIPKVFFNFILYSSG